MSVVECETIEAFEQNFNPELGVQLALFFASTDPETGESWCEDCRNALPFIEAGKPKLVHSLLFCLVG
jgi:hypothetical protein